MNDFNRKNVLCRSMKRLIPLGIMSLALLFVAVTSSSAQNVGGPSLSASEMNSVMEWIAAKVSADHLPFCYRQSFGRGAGEPLSNECGAGLEKNGELCYPKCRDGHKGDGPVCWANCPSGFTDIGAFCQKPSSYGRGGGYAWQVGDSPFSLDGATRRCERDNGGGNCEKDGALVYPKCRAGFNKVGSNVCSPACPAGYNDTGTGCAKPSYGRGAGETRGCRPGLEKNGLLCYQSCNRSGYTGEGPVCWQNCPSQTPYACGAGCATNKDECNSTVKDMVVSPVMVAASLVPGGDLIKKAGKAVDMSFKMKELAEKIKPLVSGDVSASSTLDKIKTSVQDQLKSITGEFADSFADMTSPEINSKIDRSFSPQVAQTIKVEWAKRQFVLMAQTDANDKVKTALSVVSAVDPTGLVSVVDAFYHPICKNDAPFPAIAYR